MRKAYIYKITNPLGNVYIGATLNIKDRIYRYKTCRVLKQKLIYNSIKEYKWENHSFEVIYECFENEKRYFESFYGIKYDVLGVNGLNCCIPKIFKDFSGLRQENKNLIGSFHKGKIISDEQKQKISKKSIQWHNNNEHPMKGKNAWNKGKEFLKGNLNPMFGVVRSEQWKKEHSIRMNKIKKVGINHPASKKILDLYTGIFYDSIKEASNCNNIIYSTLKNNINKTVNYRFMCI